MDGGPWCLLGNDAEIGLHVSLAPLTTSVFSPSPRSRVAASNSASEKMKGTFTSVFYSIALVNIPTHGLFRTVCCTNES